MQWQTLREQVRCSDVLGLQLGDTSGAFGVVVPLVWLEFQGSAVVPLEITVVSCTCQQGASVLLNPGLWCVLWVPGRQVTVYRSQLSGCGATVYCSQFSLTGVLWTFLC